MISDTLADAADEIRRYQEEMPECYDDIRSEIDAVLAVMGALQARLDAPPPSNLTGA